MWEPVTVKLANEDESFLVSSEAAKKDKKIFIRNLGLLLSQSREGVLGAELIDEDTVLLTFKSGYSKRVNIRADSYIAIISDVVTHGVRE